MIAIPDAYDSFLREELRYMDAQQFDCYNCEDSGEDYDKKLRLLPACRHCRVKPLQKFTLIKSAFRNTSTGQAA